MPGRKYNSKEYRYGFNGKEKDDDGEFGSITNYDYGFRIYNPAIGKFLSVDPLTEQYPMLTPYQFASNRPIDGIDLDGLEYLRYVINWYDDQDKPDIKVMWFDDENHNKHDILGGGIQYEVYHWKTSSGGYVGIEGDKTKKFFYKRQEGLFQYGNYFGALGLFKLSREGALTKEHDYDVPPIDGVDYGAWIHDNAYGAVDAAGRPGLVDDWATTPADMNAIAAWDAIVDLGEGGLDPWNLYPINKKQVDRASSGAWGFRRITNRKKRKIARWMKKENGITADHYEIFVEKYFEINERGFHIKKKRHWEVDSDGEFISGGKPIPLKEVKNNEGG